MAAAKAAAGQRVMAAGAMGVGAMGAAKVTVGVAPGVETADEAELEAGMAMEVVAATAAVVATAAVLVQGLQGWETTVAAAASAAGATAIAAVEAERAAGCRRRCSRSLSTANCHRSSQSDSASTHTSRILDWS